MRRGITTFFGRKSVSFRHVPADGDSAQRLLVEPSISGIPTNFPWREIRLTIERRNRNPRPGDPPNQLGGAVFRFSQPQLEVPGPVRLCQNSRIVQGGAVGRHRAEGIIGSHSDDLPAVDIQEGVAKYLARKIAELTIDRRAIEFERADFKLSETKAFSWRRNLPPLVAKKTVFNYVATYNDFERRFAEFLEKASDVLRFAALVFCI